MIPRRPMLRTTVCLSSELEEHGRELSDRVLIRQHAWAATFQCGANENSPSISKRLL